MIHVSTLLKIISLHYSLFSGHVRILLLFTISLHSNTMTNLYFFFIVFRIMPRSVHCTTIAKRRICFVDIISYAIYAILFMPTCIALIISLCLWVSPILIVILCIRRTCKEKCKSINEHPAIRTFSIAFNIVAIPIYIFAILWALLSSLIIIMLSLPIGMIRYHETLTSFKSLKSETMVAGVSYLRIDNYMHAIIGTIHRHGILETMFALSIMTSFVPIEKWKSTNPFLFKLQRVYLNQWTSLIPASRDRVIHLLSDTYCTKQKQIDTWVFSGFYQHPTDKSSSVAGIQMSQLYPYKSSRTLSAALLTSTEHVKVRPKSQTGKFGIYRVRLSPFNMWHHCTGYVEVNEGKNGGIEHPMWILVDSSTYIAYKSLENINRYFVETGDQLFNVLIV